MLTAGNIQFTPPSSKIFPMTSSIAALVSGDMNLHAELLAQLRAGIKDTLDVMKELGTTRWLTVKEVAEKYAALHGEQRTKAAESKFLIPLGLTRTSYIERQGALSVSLLEKLAAELVAFSLPMTSGIFAGVDESGPHLYVVSNGEIFCHDIVAFAAIGMGAYHANSHLMFSKHSRATNLARALALTYTAKKRAEVAPGVGSETDMFMIGDAIGSYRDISEAVMENLELVYQRSVASHNGTDARLEQETYEFLQQISANQATDSIDQSPVESDSGPAPTVEPAPDAEN